MNKLFIIISVLLIQSTLQIWAEPYDIKNVLSTLSSQDRAAVFNGMQVSNISDKKKDVRLVYNPNLDIFFDLENFVRLRKPQMIYESLFFIEEKNSKRRNELFVFISNQLRDIQILKTIKYRNLKDGNIHPLFDESQVVKSPTSVTTAPNLKPLETNYSPNSEQAFVFQEMPPFGEVRSLYQYDYKENYAQFIGRNITPIKYTGIKAIDEKDMFTACWVINTNQGLIIYGVGSVKVNAFASIFNSVILNSFSSRMAGLFTWLNNKIADEKNS